MSNQQNQNNAPNCNKRCLELTEHPESQSHAKRQCSENLFWPDSDDDSIFSNAKLEDLLSGRNTELFGTQAQTSSASKLHQSGSDDGLFGDTSFPATEKLLPTQDHKEAADTGGNHPIDLAEGDPDSLFKKINLNDLSITEMEDIFHGAEDFSEPLVQNTQIFLDAVAFKVPKTPEKIPARPIDESIMSKSILEGIVHGTQYETCEALRNRSILDPSIWESQAFADFEKKTASNQTKDTFPSKGDFYGLPEKVKKMILEHKGIKSLYGKLKSELPFFVNFYSF